MRNLMTQGWIAGCVLLAFQAAGCAIYTPVPAEYRYSDAGIAIPLPDDWLRYRPAKNAYVITRDGLRLERISIRFHQTEAQLDGTERRFRKDSLPHELADISLGLLAARREIRNFQVESIRSATIADHAGFSADARLADEEGLPIRLRLTGALIGDYVIEIEYAAAEAVYFERYLAAFDRLVAGIRSE